MHKQTDSGKGDMSRKVSPKFRDHWDDIIWDAECPPLTDEQLAELKPICPKKRKRLRKGGDDEDQGNISKRVDPPGRGDSD